MQNNIPIPQLYPNPDQPRKTFSERKLTELARSITENGLLEPIVVVRRSSGYMIVAGERRWRACKKAGLKKAPVRIIQANKRKIAELALLENIQREDLNLIEEAKGYQSLMDLGLTMDQVAQKMGFKQAWRIRERLDLLRLAPEYQRYLLEKRITPSQAYEMSRLPHDKQHILYDKISTGKAATYNKLRALANALLAPPPEQTAMFAPPSETEITIGKKYDRMLENLLSFIRGSFDRDEMKILKRVIRSTVDTNIQKLDLIIKSLNDIKQAMIEAQSRKESLNH